MRILLDECVDRGVAKHITGHDVRTTMEMGWGGVKNGQLLANAEKDFDVLITVDQNLPFQQNLEKSKLAIFVLIAPSNRIQHLRSLLSEVLAQLQDVQPGLCGSNSFWLKTCH